MRPDEVVVATGVWGDHRAVVTVRRDDADAEMLTSSVYLSGRSADGAWAEPGSASGSGLPAWVLDRAVSGLVSLGSQVAFAGGRWVAELTVLAGPEVCTVEVGYGGDSIVVTVPPSGLVTVPGVIRSAADAAEFNGFDAAGRLVDTRRYWPLDEYDRTSGWPDPELWR